MPKPLDLESAAFEIIAHSGQARSLGFEALNALKQKDSAKAREKLAQSRESLKLASQAQSDLLFEEINGDPIPVSLLLVHAQDHLMNSLFSIDLIEQMIDLLGEEA